MKLLGLLEEMKFQTTIATVGAVAGFSTIIPSNNNI